MGDEARVSSDEEACASFPPEFFADEYRCGDCEVLMFDEGVSGLCSSCYNKIFER